MNMRSIAKLAGVSLSTVSKAFSGSGEISDSTRQRIFDIAKEHGLYDIYKKNKFPKRVIAVICPELENDFFIEVIKLLDTKLRERDCVMLLAISHYKVERTEEFISYYTAYNKVDGIICMCPSTNLKNPSLIPGVVIFGGRRHKFDGWTQIKSDMYSSIKAAVYKLKELGHTDIGFACEDYTKGKLEDFKHALRSAALPLRAEWIGTSHEKFEQGGEEIANRWLDSGRVPTGIIVSNDYKAIGLINAFKKRGVRVPEDVSVVGIDDIRLAASFEPPLSSIRTDYDEICSKAVDILIKKIDNQYYNPIEDTAVSTCFILRESIGECRVIVEKIVEKIDENE